MVRVSPEWWETLQVDLKDAVDYCNDVTAAIAAHRHAGKYDAEELLDRIDGDIRQIRKLLETKITPI